MKELADPTPADAAYIARLRKAYTERCDGKSDGWVMEYFNPNGYRYVECALWDNLKDAVYDFEQLADAYMKLKRATVETPAAPDDELNAWQRPSALGFSYEQVRGMDDGEAIKAGLDSGDRLAHELANRLDLARGEQLRPMSCECEFDDYQAWQYKRICLFCGHEWYGLHCPHDGHQNPCPLCGKRPEVVPESRS
jgi:hypothetical protein